LRVRTPYFQGIQWLFVLVALQKTSFYIDDLETIAQGEELSKEMKTFCHFLEDGSPGQSQRCGAGVNFVSVGPSRSLCRTCAWSDMGNIPLCPNLEVYTFLSKDSSGDQVIKVEFECFADDTLPAEERCQHCPHPELVEVRTSDEVSIPTRS